MCRSRPSCTAEARITGRSGRTQGERTVMIPAAKARRTDIAGSELRVRLLSASMPPPFQICSRLRSAAIWT